MDVTWSSQIHKPGLKWIDEYELIELQHVRNGLLNMLESTESQ